MVCNNPVNYPSGSIIISAVLCWLPRVGSAWGLQIDLVLPAVLFLSSVSPSLKGAVSGSLQFVQMLPLAATASFCWLVSDGSHPCPGSTPARVPQQKTSYMLQRKCYLNLKEFPFPTYKLINHHTVGASLSAQRICRTHNNDLSTPLQQTSTALLTHRAKPLSVWYFNKDTQEDP